MNKLAFLFTLIFVLSISAFAGEGQTTSGGGRTCPQGQTCLVEPIDRDEPTDGDHTFKDFFTFLKEFFV